MSFSVLFHTSEQTIISYAGETLYGAAKRNGLFFQNACGGLGTCGKCMVKIKEAGVIKEVLACKYKILADIEVFSQSFFDYSERIYLTDEILPCSCEDSLLAVKDISFSEYSFSNFVSRLESSISSIKDPDLDFIRSVAELPLESIKAVLTFGDYPCLPIQDKTGLSVGVMDLGTTAIKCSLIDLSEKRVKARGTVLNAQCVFGSDITARIEASKSYLTEMSELVWNVSLSLFRNMADKTDLAFPSLLFFAGNTVMTHIFYKVSPISIRKIPSVAPASLFPMYRRDKLSVFSVPSIAGYVGGDIVSGMAFCNFCGGESLTMLIDLGTNGEIALGGSDWSAVCSASAGPAFEGGGIKCGMGAFKGAIDKFFISPAGKIEFSTVSGDPSGICAGGLVSLISGLFAAGFVDKKGRFTDSAPFVSKVGVASRMTLFSSSQGEVFIDEEDISCFIRAKAAIYAGAESLLASFGFSWSDLDAIYIAGNIAEHVSIEDFWRIGLLPPLDKTKFKMIGNSSLLGCENMLFSRRLFNKALELAKTSFYVDLSSDPNFMERWTAALFLPHTDENLFKR